MRTEALQKEIHANLIFFHVLSHHLHIFCLSLHQQTKQHFFVKTMGFLQNFKAFAMKSNVIGATTGEERQRT